MHLLVAKGTMRPLNLIIIAISMSVGAASGRAQEIGDPSGAAYELERLPDVDPRFYAPTGELPWTTPPPPSYLGTGSWYQSWFNAEEWDATFELGINGGAGNTDSFSLKTGAKIKRDTERVTQALDISYARTSANSLTTQDLFIQDAKQDWKFGDSPFSLFFNQRLLRDKLRDFDWRLTLNGGIGYQLFETEIMKLKGRFGAGTTREIGGLDDDWVPEQVFGIDFERKLSKRQKLTAVVDYYPEWGDYNNYRVVGKVGWEILLDEDPNLSLKVEVIELYDSTPNGLKPNDLNYSLLLLLKL